MEATTEIQELRAGDKVHYTSPYGTKENGIVKEISESGTFAWVVFNCNSEWEMYFKYTGQCTNIEDLTIGWI